MNSPAVPPPRLPPPQEVSGFHLLGTLRAHALTSPSSIPCMCPCEMSVNASREMFNLCHCRHLGPHSPPHTITHTQARATSPREPPQPAKHRRKIDPRKNTHSLSSTITFMPVTHPPTPEVHAKGSIWTTQDPGAHFR